MRKIIFAMLALAVSLAADQKPETTPQRGTKGGCYIVVLRKKDSKPYKKYIDPAKCKGIA